MADRKLIQAVEAYFTDLRLVRSSGGATGERSLHVPLANLLNTVGGSLTPKVSACRTWCKRRRSQTGTPLSPLRFLRNSGP